MLLQLTAAVVVAVTNLSVPKLNVDVVANKLFAQNYMLEQYGWNETEFNCLVPLWEAESGWRTNAHNKTSGAYGIPQALPGSKMATAGADWKTNPQTQIKWGLNYIAHRYQTACGAYSHFKQKHWY